MVTHTQGTGPAALSKTSLQPRFDINLVLQLLQIHMSTEAILALGTSLCGLAEHGYHDFMTVKINMHTSYSLI